MAPAVPARRTGLLARVPLPLLVIGAVLVLSLVVTWSYEASNTVVPGQGLGSFTLSDYLSVFGSWSETTEVQAEPADGSSVEQGQPLAGPMVQPHALPHSHAPHHNKHPGSHHVPAHGHSHKKNLTRHWSGIVSLVIFVGGYFLVIMEDKLQPYFRKSVPMTVAAGLIWAIVSIALDGGHGAVAAAARHNLLEFGEVFLFLLVAMTYISTMEELNVFQVLRAPLADNLTTAMLMGAVLTNIGRDQEQFIILGCINVVVAANAGGAFSPFGDITTLMMWQRGKLHIVQFFALVVPSIVNWVVPATIMSLYVPKGTPSRVTGELIMLAPGGIAVVLLFLCTISMTASFHSTFHLPPVLGMMTGLGFLQMYGFFGLRKARQKGPGSDHNAEWTSDSKDKSLTKGASKGDLKAATKIEPAIDSDEEKGAYHGEKAVDRMHPLNIFRQLEKAEWDTLLFFYGVVMCVGALGLIGYLDGISQLAYEDLGPTAANVMVGFLSAVVDNIPVMYAVLSTDPTMSVNQWLLVTLTAGVGGSILSVGSAAGVGLMGQARGMYTFKEHLKWSWAVILGYAASIMAHLVINGW
eukprot:jgi/Tetstr1/434821/TSEL_002539.t1